MNEKHIKGVQRASAAVAIAATLAITGGALAGCSGNSNDDNGQVVEESAVVEQGDGGAASADPVMVAKVIQEVTGAYVGQTDDGVTVYYALTDDGTQCILRCGPPTAPTSRGWATPLQTAKRSSSPTRLPATPSLSASPRRRATRP